MAALASRVDLVASAAGLFQAAVFPTCAERNPRDPVANRMFQIFLEPMLRARDGLFDSDDPRCRPRS